MEIRRLTQTLSTHCLQQVRQLNLGLEHIPCAFIWTMRAPAGNVTELEARSLVCFLLFVTHGTFARMTVNSLVIPDFTTIPCRFLWWEAENLIEPSGQRPQKIGQSSVKRGREVELASRSREWTYHSFSAFNDIQRYSKYVEGSWILLGICWGVFSLLCRCPAIQCLPVVVVGALNQVHSPLRAMLKIVLLQLHAITLCASLFHVLHWHKDFPR